MTFFSLVYVFIHWIQWSGGAKWWELDDESETYRLEIILLNVLFDNVSSYLNDNRGICLIAFPLSLFSSLLNQRVRRHTFFFHSFYKKNHDDIVLLFFSFSFFNMNNTWWKQKLSQGQDECVHTQAVEYKILLFTFTSSFLESNALFMIVFEKKVWQMANPTEHVLIHMPKYEVKQLFFLMFTILIIRLNEFISILPHPMHQKILQIFKIIFVRYRMLNRLFLFICKYFSLCRRPKKISSNVNLLKYHYHHQLRVLWTNRTK